MFIIHVTQNALPIPFLCLHLKSAKIMTSIKYDVHAKFHDKLFVYICHTDVERGWLSQYSDWVTNSTTILDRERYSSSPRSNYLGGSPSPAFFVRVSSRQDMQLTTHHLLMLRMHGGIPPHDMALS